MIDARPATDQTTADRATDPPLRVAHRAGNDPALLAAALAAGADAVEADVHLRGRRLELRHAKALGPLPWVWDRWYVARRGPSPSLEDLLAAVAPPTAVLLDLKGPSARLAPRVRQAIRRHARGPVWICSRTWTHLRGPGGDDVRVLRSIGSRAQLARYRAVGGGGDGVSIAARLADERTVAALHRRVPLALAWGARDRAEAARLLRCGVDGLILDDLGLHPRRAVAGEPVFVS